MRLFIHLMIVWTVVSWGIYTWIRLTNRDQIHIAKIVLFGGMTAAITTGLLATIVFIF